jgi:glycerol-3-phosphate acyltransferase PlsX
MPRIRIAVDAMGGDHAPGVIVEGVRVAALGLDGDTEIILVGREEAILECGGGNLGATIVPADDVVEMDDPPAQAVRRKRGSSMAKAVDLVREGRADAILSLGNTGALMAFCKVILGCLEGIQRPAIAVPMPHRTGYCLMLDAGANADCQPVHLSDFALMGSVYAQEVWGIAQPRVGLLSIGTEETKGKELTFEAAKLIRELPVHFIGNVEGDSVSQGTVDVVVCDGFTGNAMLKYGEGLASLILSRIRKAVSDLALDQEMKVVAAKIMQKCMEGADYSETGGAPFLGIAGTCLKAHGRSGPKAVANGLLAAGRAVGHRVNERIVAGIRAETQSV